MSRHAPGGRLWRPVPGVTDSPKGAFGQMIILGLLFILFVALVGTWFYLALADLAGGGPANDLSAMGITIGLSPAALLLTGFASALALAMGLYLIKAGLSSSARRRRERKDLERTAAESQRAADAAAAERLRTEKAAPVEPTRRSVTEPVRDSTAGWTPGDGRRG
ncbi:hypothetical protein [Nostocoides sp.]|uniref:hypothetical protein n=1 Tax=Nostocoides sp. TaxID=1917966 RepID=UPI003C7357AA